MLCRKIEKKGRTKDELYKVIEWFTGFNNKDINKAIVQKWTFKEFFDCAKLNDNSFLIKGSICGHKIDAIENSLTQILYFFLVTKHLKVQLINKKNYSNIFDFLEK